MFVTGQRVICVNATFLPWVYKLYTQIPVKDGIYSIRAIFPGREIPGVIKDGKLVENGGSMAAPTIGVTVNELVNPPDPWCSQRELSFQAERFAPLEEIEQHEPAVAEVEKVPTPIVIP